MFDKAQALVITVIGNKILSITPCSTMEEAHETEARIKNDQSYGINTTTSVLSFAASDPKFIAELVDNLNMLVIMGGMTNNVNPLNLN